MLLVDEIKKKLNVYNVDLLPPTLKSVGPLVAGNYHSKSHG